MSTLHFEKQNSITHCSLPKCSISATAERLFSMLMQLKNWLRTMNEDCIIMQALMNVHEDIEVCVDKVINRFAGITKYKIRLCHIVCK